MLEGTRLYLRRYWQHEQTVRAGIAQRLAPAQPWSGEARARVRAALDVLFDPLNGTDWQKVACALALRSRFAIVTGGPGTGKTTTVVKLLALLQHLSLSATDGAPRRLRIRLAAPTGKAAARLNASIANAVAGLPLQRIPDGDAVRAAIPTEVGTVHRLLGSQGATRRFRHGPGNPLPLDVLVLMQEQVVPLSILRARPIGMMTMVDQGQADEKIICIHLDDPEYQGYADIHGLPSHRLMELRRFFQDYKKLEHKEVSVRDFLGPCEAMETVERGMQLYAATFGDRADTR